MWGQARGFQEGAINASILLIIWCKLKNQRTTGERK
jgi:hypothetical protein